MSRNLSPRILRCILATLLVTGVACTPDGESKGDNSAETALSGTITVPVDAAILHLLDSAKALYDAEHPNAHITLVAKDPAATMDRMLNGLERIAIIARDYTPEEDSAIGVIGGDTLMRSLLARDAIVFFAAKSFPYDTMNSNHIRMWLAGENKVWSGYPALAAPPQFIISGGSTSSVYGNIMNVVLKGGAPSVKRLATVDTFDSLLTTVATIPGAVGVAYLSQVYGNPNVKLLRLSYTNSDGSHEYPKPVHVSYLIMGKYPFPVPIYVYLKDRPNMYSLPSGLMQFLTRSGNAQRTFLSAGIEPGYAKFSLVLPEE